jgi:hypothetical protein
LGIIKRTGQWLDFVIGYLDDSVKDVVKIDHLNAVVIEDEAVALAWKFAGNYSGYVSVRANTLTNDQLNIISSVEDQSLKVKYYLTDEDKYNGTKFMKIGLRKFLDEVYDRRLRHVNLGVTDLEQNTWPQQRSEAEAYNLDNAASTPMLDALAAARNITKAEMVQKVLSAIQNYNQQISDLLATKQGIESEIKNCLSMADLNILMHQRFGYNMPAAQQQDLDYQGGSVYNL